MTLTGAIIDTRRGFVHLESGETLPVKSWFDADGCDCSPGEACALVCGPDREGMWVSLEVFADEAKPTLN